MTAWTGGVFGSSGVSAGCVLAPNPGPMTLDGTNTWVLRAGAGRSVVVDPGPLHQGHLERVAAAAGDVAVVLLTHHHLDHAEGARAFAERVGCAVRALDPAFRLGDEGLGDGDVVVVGDLEVRVVGTPGHTADSLSFLVPETGTLLTGDTVLGRGTTVVAWPDGSLGPYLDSLERLRGLCADQPVSALWPGHGPVLDDPTAAVDGYLAHRRERLAQVADAASDLGPGASPADVVAVVYADVDRALWPAAELSVRAQLDHLRSRRSP